MGGMEKKGAETTAVLARPEKSEGKSEPHPLKKHQRKDHGMMESDQAFKRGFL